MYFSENPEIYDFFVKIVSVGKSQIGKSFLSRKIAFFNDYKTFNQLPKYYNSTIGLEFMEKGKKLNNKMYKFRIWDASGQERFQLINTFSYDGANFILIFYDALDKDSFNKAKTLYKQAFENNKNIIYFLIRIKYDLNLNSEKNEIVSDEEALEFADKNNLIFTHISSFEKYEDGIENLFDLILKEYNLRVLNNII